MRPRTVERVLLLALLAGAVFLSRHSATRDLVALDSAYTDSLKTARVQTDDALRVTRTLQDSLARRGARVDTVVRTLAGVADTIRLRANVPGDSVVLPKFEVLAWADKLDKAVNEVSKYRADVDRLTKQIADTVAAVIRAERVATDSLLAVKDRRIKAERAQGRKEGALFVGFTVLVGFLVF